MPTVGQVEALLVHGAGQVAPGDRGRHRLATGRAEPEEDVEAALSAVATAAVELGDLHAAVGGGDLHLGAVRGRAGHVPAGRRGTRRGAVWARPARARC